MVEYRPGYREMLQREIQQLEASLSAESLAVARQLTDRLAQNSAARGSAQSNKKNADDPS